MFGLRFVIAVLNQLVFRSEAVNLFFNRLFVDNALLHQFGNALHFHDAHPEAGHFLDTNADAVRVVMSLELRDLSTKKIYSLYEQIEEEAKAIAIKTDTKIMFTPIEATAVPAPTDTRVRRIIADSAQELGLTLIFMPSGAGHDAQNMARIAPTGMIFVPSVDGVSHSPKEYTLVEDMASGANVLLHAILKIDKGALD